MNVFIRSRSVAQVLARDFRRYSCEKKSDQPVYDCPYQKKTKYEEEPIIHSAMRKDFHKHDYRKWRNIFLFIFLPAIVLQSLYICYVEPEQKRVPFVPYPYLRKRTTKFPWGDGNHTLFHNPRVNALPEGYEYELDEDEENK